ncbi:MAG: ribonuclease P protein component [Pararhodobacter sp.]
MTPPAASVDSQIAGTTAAPAALSCLAVLRKRADFLHAARARRQGAPAFLLQARQRGTDEAATGIRVGFTCSRKVGNAVARNRAKRRLRAIAREVLARRGKAGWDYVLVGRAEATANRPYADLLRDLERALSAIHAPQRDNPAAPS